MFKPEYPSIETIAQMLSITSEDAKLLLIHQARINGYSWLVSMVILIACIAILVYVSHAWYERLDEIPEAIFILIVAVVCILIVVMLFGIPRISSGIFNPEIYVMKYMLIQ